MVRSLPPLLESNAPPLVTAGSVAQEQFTYADVARVKLVTKQTVYEWVKRGMIPSPIYTGSTARFTRDQFDIILTGCSEPGSYTPAPSPRALVGALGAAKKQKRKRARKPAPTTAKEAKKNTRKKDTRKKTTPTRKGK